MQSCALHWPRQTLTPELLASGILLFSLRGAAHGLAQLGEWMSVATERRDVRYQAAVVRDDHVLLLRVFDRADGVEFWLLPGGGREPGEGEAECLRRELREETHLLVEVGPLLFETPDIPEGMYDRLRTYRCTVVAGEARPGSEPEVDHDGQTTRDFRPYSTRTIADELARRGLFRELGEMPIAPVPFAQPVADYIAAFHARNGLARERMGASAAAFDSALAAILARHCPDGVVHLQVGAGLIWGEPRSVAAAQ